MDELQRPARDDRPGAGARRPHPRRRRSSAPSSSRRRDKRRLGELLISDGQLTEPQLTKTLRTNAEAHLYDLFLWSDGRFEFDDERPPAAGALGPRHRAQPVLEEGRHRRELWSQLRRRFPSNEITFHLTADPVSVTDPAPPADHRPRRLGQDARRDQPRVAPLGVRDDAAPRRPVRPGDPRGGAGGDGGPGGRPGGHHHDPPGGRRDEDSRRGASTPRSRPTRGCSPSTA